MGRIISVVASAIMVFCLLVHPLSAQQRNMTIGMTNWAENIAVANLWKILLAERGYQAELRTVDRVLAFSGLARGDIDLGLETWLPKTDKSVMDRFGKSIEVHDSWYKGTRQGFVVPSYVPINSIRELSEHEADFPAAGEKAAVVGIDPGSSLMQMAEKVLKTYDLDMKLINSSETGMMSALARAYRDHAPIVVTLWSPHWAFAQYDLKYLDDTENDFGGSDDIHFMSRAGFGQDFPEVLGWLNAWTMSDGELGSLMLTIERAGNAEAGARQWLAENRSLADGWLAAKGTVSP
jgi:glycine betaine/proline transport system substrate-binding protein